jgi:hypothetical protein
MKPWGRLATLGLGLVALIAGQVVALLALSHWYGVSLAHMPDFSGDGIAVTILILVSTPVQVALLALFAQRRGDAAAYLGLTLPRRGDLIVGVAAVVGLIAVSDVVSSFLGHSIVTPFQTDIYRTTSGTGWLLWLWFATIVVTPIGEETLFRGFLFRGWIHAPRDTWPVIVITAGLWAVIHVQYDWFVIGQVFIFGLLLGWLRWVSGSTLLTILLHGIINFEGMLETLIDLKWLT